MKLTYTANVKTGIHSGCTLKEAILKTWPPGNTNCKNNYISVRDRNVVLDRYKQTPYKFKHIRNLDTLSDALDYLEETLIL